MKTCVRAKNVSLFVSATTKTRLKKHVICIKIFSST